MAKGDGAPPLPLPARPSRPPALNLPIARGWAETPADIFKSEVRVELDFPLSFTDGALSAVYVQGTGLVVQVTRF